MCFAVGKKGVGCNRSFARSKKGTNIATDNIFLLQGLAITKTKKLAGEDLPGMQPTTALGDVLIGPSLPSSTTAGQAQEEGGCHCVQ